MHSVIHAYVSVVFVMANGVAEAGDLLESLGVAAVDASAVEKDLWAQVSRYMFTFLWSACGVYRHVQVKGGALLLCALHLCRPRQQMEQLQTLKRLLQVC